MTRWTITLTTFLTTLALLAPAWAQDEEETGITAGLIDEDKRIGELDTFYYDVLQDEENKKIDPSAAWTVEDLTLEMDSLTVTFAEGEFFPRKAIEGNVYGAVFIGTGTWTFVPDLAMEQDELERLAKVRSQENVSFSDMYFEFAPQYLEKLKVDAGPASGDEKVAKDAEKLWELRRGETSALYSTIDRFIAWGHVDGMQYVDFFSAGVQLDDSKFTRDAIVKAPKPVYNYSWDATQPEEITLGRWWVNPLNDLDAKYEILCNFPRKEDRENKSRRELAYKNPATYNVDHYVADFEVYKDPDSKEYGIKGDVTIHITSILRDVKVVPFSLITSFAVGSAYSNPVRVTAVSDTEGTALPHLHKSHTLAVELPEPLPKGESTKVRVQYYGDIIGVIKQPDPEMSIQDQADAAQAMPEFMGVVNYSLLNTYPWFPQNYGDSWQLYTWEWTWTVPEPLVMASSGTMTDMVDDGKNTVYTIKESVPSGLASVILGRFSVVSDPPEENRKRLVRVFAHPGQLDSAEEIRQQAHDIIDFYEELYQVDYPYPELDIAQMPYGVGFAQAPPGLVQMSGEAYLSKTLLATVYNVNDPVIREMFLPHEIAHEWWGHCIGTRTGHDYWLMEAGAEYSAALFWEAAEGQKEYDKYVKYWLKRRNAQNTKKTSSLWIAATGRNSERYVATIYGRGPLLYHELRQSLGFEKFVSVLRAMLIEWKGQKIATEDFKMVLEKATGLSFDQYFEQFVYHNEPLSGASPEDLQ